MDSGHRHRFPGGDATTGQSGWRVATAFIPASALDGSSEFEMIVQDQGDAVYDSVGLIDKLQFL
jgi:hypothetical protein